MAYIAMAYIAMAYIVVGVAYIVLAHLVSVFLQQRGLPQPQCAFLHGSRFFPPQGSADPDASSSGWADRRADQDAAVRLLHGPSLFFSSGIARQYFPYTSLGRIPAVWSSY